MPDTIINGKKIHYIDKGEGPVILFGHSFLFDSKSWEPQIEILCKSFRCIAPDLWGHGQSEPLDTPQYSIDQMVDDMWEFTQALGLEKFSLVGLSVGGMWGTALTLQHSQSVEHLVLMDSYVGSEEEDKKRLYLKMLSAVEQAQCVPEPVVEKTIPMFFSQATLDTKGSALVAMLEANLNAVNAKNAATLAAIGRAIFTRGSLLEKLETITCPVLILVGDEDTPRPPKESEEMAKLINNAQLKIIKGAGHISSLEQPENVNQALLSFFEH